MTKKKRVIISLDDYEFSILEAMRHPIISIPYSESNKILYTRSEVIGFLLRSYKLGSK